MRIIFFLVTFFSGTCFSMGPITFSEWEIYFANKNKKQLGANPIFKRGFALCEESKDKGPAIALDIGCGVGFEAAWILQNGWDRVDCIDPLPVVKDYLMKNVPEWAEKQGRLTFTPVPIQDFEIATSYQLVCAYFSLFYCDTLEEFDAVMKKALGAVASEGRFIGSFFGPKHSWNGQRKMIFLTEEELKAYFLDFTIEIFERTENDYDSGIGMAHYDMFHITAKKH
jgi:SAM-dependent methyltransferase